MRLVYAVLAIAAISSAHSQRRSDAVIIQRRIRNLQFPLGPCKCARVLKIHLPHDSHGGFANMVHWAGAAQMLALEANRMLIVTNEDQSQGECNHMDQSPYIDP
jgi:hypothetical protein